MIEEMRIPSEEGGPCGGENWCLPSLHCCGGVCQKECNESVWIAPLIVVVGAAALLYAWSRWG